MKRILKASLVLSAMALGACGSADESSFGASSPSSAGDRGGSSDPGSGSSSSSGGLNSGAAPPSSSSTTTAPGSQEPVSAGVLTAGVWDDNMNFDFFKKYVGLSTPQGVPSFTQAERDVARGKWAQRSGSANELDLTFLIDTTGSMGDELSYIQNEIDNISLSIKAKFPQTTPRFGLVLYKDQGDSYVTRWFDFKGIEEFRTNLKAQTVGGGGDLPEAVGDGLAKSMQLSWRSGAVARMTFWIADAPHHEGQEQAVRAAIDSAAQSDVHIYPVAASGTDDRAEYTMRSAAQITGGRYIFLTDDSGVGNSHAEPHIPCYRVTKFNSAIVRMVESEISGTHIEPAATEVIRSVGNPSAAGTCATTGGDNVQAF